MQTGNATPLFAARDSLVASRAVIKDITAGRRPLDETAFTDASADQVYRNIVTTTRSFASREEPLPSGRMRVIAHDPTRQDGIDTLSGAWATAWRGQNWIKSLEEVALPDHERQGFLMARTNFAPPVVPLTDAVKAALHKADWNYARAITRMEKAATQLG